MTADFKRVRNESDASESPEGFLRSEQGLTIVEYAIAAGLIVATVGAAYVLLGTTIDAIIVTVMGFL